MFKSATQSEVLPLREVYYSAFDINVYHTISSCPEGMAIPDNYLRKVYLVPTFAQKCAHCAALEAEDNEIVQSPAEFVRSKIENLKTETPLEKEVQLEKQ